jgi:uncharacterized membrane protein YqgA involved in biofilm formation
MTDFVLFGALANALLVVLGSLVGMIFHGAVHRKKGAAAEGMDGAESNGLGKRISDAIFKGIGRCVILIGLDGAIKGAVNNQISDALSGSGVALNDISGEKTLVIIVSMVIGVIIGELVDLDKRINGLGDRIQRLMKGRGGNVAQGFVSASLLFCVGSMAIVGALNSGISGDHTIQITKGVIDMVAAIIFASSFGVGVLFSSVLVFLYQGLISLLASYIQPFLTVDVITCMTAVGSLVIIALGLNLLGVTKMKIMNFVPAIFLPIAFVPLGDWLAVLL